MIEDKLFSKTTGHKNLHQQCNNHEDSQKYGRYYEDTIYTLEHDTLCKLTP